MAYPSSGWNFRGINLTRRYKSGFKKLRDLYGKELVKVHKDKLSSNSLTKEEKRRVKEKIRFQIQARYIGNIFAFILAVILTILFSYLVVYLLS
jgi:hypothetical protein